MLPIQFVCAENGEEKTFLEEHKRRVEIAEHNQNLPVPVSKIKNGYQKAFDMDVFFVLFSSLSTKFLQNPTSTPTTKTHNNNETLIDIFFKQGGICYNKEYLSFSLKNKGR